MIRKGKLVSAVVQGYFGLSETVRSIKTATSDGNGEEGMMGKLLHSGPEVGGGSDDPFQLNALRGIAWRYALVVQPRQC